VCWVLAACATVSHGTTTVNFDDLSTGRQPGNIIPGLTFTTCHIPDQVAVGDFITPTNLADGIWVVDDEGAALSPPNYIIPRDEIALDLRIQFDKPVTRVKLWTDHYPDETPDPVRLLAVRQTTTPGRFEVLEVTETTDDTQTWMAVGDGTEPFTAVIFQALNELEGLDDLSFTEEGTAVDPNDVGTTGPPPQDATSTGGQTDGQTGGQTSDGTSTGDDTSPTDSAAGTSGGAALCPSVSGLLVSGLVLGLRTSRRART
jgi:hypothetical protein